MVTEYTIGFLDCSGIMIILISLVYATFITFISRRIKINENCSRQSFYQGMAFMAITIFIGLFIIVSFMHLTGKFK